MKNSLYLIAMIGILAIAVTFIKPDIEANAGTVPKPNDLIVHEWGTFTTIAGKGGVAIDWQPLNGATDLPKFVYTDSKHDGFRGTYADPGKGRLARVRMETPVIYFYTQRNMDVSVKVAFPQGKITEWYPQASVVNTEFLPNKKGVFESGINWGTIKLLPKETPEYMREIADSHYYPARETDAVPIQVCNADKTRVEKEKFLFYRGIGNFDLPLKARIDRDKITLGTADDKYLSKSDPGRNLTNVIVFENRGGRIGYTVVPSISGDTPVERPQLNRTLSGVYAEIENALVLRGLYQKEARAMIETWKDSWFEEGLRVFYVLPRATTDEVLPLTVEPRPKETVRVLVGRAEVITPEMEKDVRRQVSLLRSRSAATRFEARSNLKKHGRFYEPILKSVLQNEADPKVRGQIERLIAVK